MGLVRELGLEPFRVGGEPVARRHCSRLEGKLTVARLSRRLLASTDGPHPNILRRVVIRVRFRLALLTAEVITSRAILVGGKATLGTPLRRVRRTHLLYRHSNRLGFVLHLFVERSERPRVPPRRTRSLADARQVLERNYVTVVAECPPSLTSSSASSAASFVILE